jgi:Arc/MetJ-type ribon-helix-helix transcriptional regulator
MAKTTRDITKKRKPRPPATGEPVLVRLQPGMAKAIDGWIKDQDDRPSRPEAIRRLVGEALAKPTKAGKL